MASSSCCESRLRKCVKTLEEKKKKKEQKMSDENKQITRPKKRQRKHLIAYHHHHCSVPNGERRRRQTTAGRDTSFEKREILRIARVPRNADAQTQAQFRHQSGTHLDAASAAEHNVVHSRTMTTRVASRGISKQQIFWTQCGSRLARTL